MKNEQEKAYIPGAIADCIHTAQFLALVPFVFINWQGRMYLIVSVFLDLEGWSRQIAEHQQIHKLGTRTHNEHIRCLLVHL